MKFRTSTKLASRALVVAGISAAISLLPDAGKIHIHP